MPFLKLQVGKVFFRQTTDRQSAISPLFLASMFYLSLKFYIFILFFVSDLTLFYVSCITSRLLELITEL